jgi:nucleotide-binding universal stress UspA family protein
MRILVPFDFSAGAELALSLGCAHARGFNAQLTLLHVIHLPYLGSGFGPGEGLGIEDSVVSEVSAQISEIAKKVKNRGVRARAIVRIGSPVGEIVENARRERADLIVMGTHGRTGVKHVLLGSVAEGVLRRAPCPVLVARGQPRR